MRAVPRLSPAQLREVETMDEAVDQMLGQVAAMIAEIADLQK